MNKEQKIKEAKVLKEKLETITGRKVRLIKEAKENIKDELPFFKKIFDNPDFNTHYSKEYNAILVLSTSKEYNAPKPLVFLSQDDFNKILKKNKVKFEKYKISTTIIHFRNGKDEYKYFIINKK